MTERPAASEEEQVLRNAQDDKLFSLETEICRLTGSKDLQTDN